MKRMIYDHNAESKLVAFFLIDRLEAEHFEEVKRKVFKILEIDQISLVKRAQMGLLVEKSLFDHREEYLLLFRNLRKLYSTEFLIGEIVDAYLYGIENGILVILDSIDNFLMRLIYSDLSDYKISTFNREVSKILSMNNLFEKDFYNFLKDIFLKFNFKTAIDLTSDHVFLRIKEHIKRIRLINDFVSDSPATSHDNKMNESSWKYIIVKILYSYLNNQEMKYEENKQLDLISLNQEQFFKFVENRKISLLDDTQKNNNPDKKFDFAITLSGPIHKENPKNSFIIDFKHSNIEIQDIIPQAKWKIDQSLDYEDSLNDWNQIEKLLDHINDEGILLYIIPTRALTSQLRKSFRERFLMRDLLRVVIDLPNGYLKYTNIDVSALIITKQGTGMHLLSLNASGYLENSLDEIFDEFISKGKESSKNKGLKYYSKLDLEDLENLNYEVSPELVYFRRTRLIENVMVLADALDTKEKNKPLFRGVSIRSNHWVPKGSLSEPEYSAYYVQANNILDHEIDFDNLITLDEENYKYSRYELKIGDFIITTRTTQIKTLVFRPKSFNSRCVASGTMIVIRLDKDKLVPFFLKAYLDSELGRHQIKSITKKQMSNLNLLTINDLKQLKIPKLSIEEQQRIAKIYVEKIREINSAKKILDIANEDYSLTFNELFSEYGS